MKFLSAVTVAVSLASAPALADGQKSGHANLESTVMSPSVMSVRDWSGAYAGLGLSYRQTSYSTSGGSTYQGPNATGPGARVTLGYSLQQGAFVYGAEAVATFSNAGGTSTNCGAGVTSCESKTANSLGARLRFGYAFDDTLLFSTVGYETDAQWNRAYGAGGGIIGEDSARHHGATIGIGAEQAFSDWLSVRGDLEYYHFNKETYNFVAPGATTLRPKTTTASISLVTKF